MYTAVYPDFREFGMGTETVFFTVFQYEQSLCVKDLIIKDPVGDIGDRFQVIGRICKDQVKFQGGMVQEFEYIGTMDVDVLNAQGGTGFSHKGTGSGIPFDKVNPACSP